MHSEISFGRASALFNSAIGMGPGRTVVSVDEKSVHVKMGWAFSVDIPRDEIVGTAVVTDPPWWWGVGAHLIGRNRWIVNGTLSGLVDIRTRTPIKGRALGMPVPVESLVVSVADPARLVRSLV